MTIETEAAGVRIPALLEDCTPEEIEAVFAATPAPELRTAIRHFPDWAHTGQLSPEGDWHVWVMMAGRGFGKTRAGSEWVLDFVRHAPGSARVALVAATIEEGRAIMVEGASGLLACAGPGDIAQWSPDRRTIRFGSGAEATLFSGRSPEGLRGPEHDIAWCDELAKWAKGRATWDNLMFGLRRGDRPRVLVTTTPRAGTVLNAIIAMPGTVLTGGPTQANMHLPEAYIRAVEASYKGTRLGRQELDGELLEDVEGSLWPAKLIEKARREPRCAQFTRIVIGVDPPATAAGTCGIIVCGLDATGTGWVLDDRSIAGASPEGWARAVATAATDWRADRIIAEANQGGDMVAQVLASADAALPVRLVRATRGKASRAEPVAAQFERGRAVFGGRFPELEAELAGLTAGGGYHGPGPSTGSGSPDRADAMVWALWALLIDGVPEPTMRFL